MLKLNNLQECFLKALARYKLLTVSQVLDLGISTSKNSAIHQILKLKKEGLVNSSSYSGTFDTSPQGIRKVFKYENLHYLTPKGAKIVAEIFAEHEDAPEHITAVKPAFSNDYLHRVMSISAHISYDKFIEKNNFETELFLTYYTKGKGKLQGQTRIQINEKEKSDPDLIMKYRTGTDEKGLLVELWNGVDTKYIISQLTALYHTITDKKASEKLQFKNSAKVPRILSVFRFQETLEIVRKKIADDSYFNAEAKEKLFLFKTFENMKTDFGKNWINLKGEMINL